SFPKPYLATRDAPGRHLRLLSLVVGRARASCDVSFVNSNVVDGSSIPTTITPQGADRTRGVVVSLGAREGRRSLRQSARQASRRAARLGPGHRTLCPRS